MTATTTSALAASAISAPSARSRLRAVAVPSEHGGWGLVAEPCLLGLAVAPSASGAFLAASTFVAFLLRTPAKIVFIDRRRGRWLPRTSLAAAVSAVEAAVLMALVVAAVAVRHNPHFWVPGLVAAPLLAVEAWYEVRSRGRRLVPELAGAIGVCSVAPMILLADGRSPSLAAVGWVVLGARVVTSIPHVRSNVDALHGRTRDTRVTAGADAVSTALALIAIAIDSASALGAIAVIAVIAAQRLTSRGEPAPAVVLGVRQTLFGFGIVAAAAAGVLTHFP